ncbi:MAG: hypothetical protein A2599_02760 [Candidatus Staskawiczbacteria bacterium RIFOXYD1_FULL_39_28]|nr:MAG: hypothetical protein A2599_02760 [Candidatus Staskawiczbacteria bacterium RIFOXYD1_FULL_39_28]
MSKKILIIAGIAILLTLIFGVFVLLQINNLRKPQVSSLEAQAKAIQNQIQQIDSEYRQKMNEITDKQKQNNCIESKDVEMIKTLTGEKQTEKQWSIVSMEGICGDLFNQNEALAKERSYKTSQLQTQMDLLTARTASDREKAMTAIRTFMVKPDLELVYTGTRHPSNFNVGVVVNRDEGGYTMEGFSGWERRVEVYQQTEYINDRCEVYEYEVDVRNNQIVEIHVRYPDGLAGMSSGKCTSYGSMEVPLKTKDEIEKVAFAYLSRDPEHTKFLIRSDIKPEYLPSKTIAKNPAMNEWRWEDKSYKLPEGLTSDPFPYPMIRIIISSGGKLVYYLNTTELFN